MDFDRPAPFQNDLRRSTCPIGEFFNLHPTLLAELFDAQSTGQTAEAFLEDYIANLEKSQHAKGNPEGDSDPTKLNGVDGEDSASEAIQNNIYDSSTFSNGRIDSPRASDVHTSSTGGSLAQAGSNSKDDENCNQISTDGTTVPTTHESSQEPLNRQDTASKSSTGPRRELPQYPTDDDLEFCSTLLVENISPLLDLEELANIFNYYVEIIPISMTIHPPIDTHKTAILWLEFVNPIETRAAWVILDGYRTHGKGMIPKLRFRPPEVDSD